MDASGPPKITIIFLLISFIILQTFIAFSDCAVNGMVIPTKSGSNFSMLSLMCLLDEPSNSYLSHFLICPHVSFEELIQSLLQRANK